jgi:hypothetical protein
MVRKTLALSFMIFLAALIIGTPGFAEKLTTIKVSATGLLVDAPFYIGQEKGYFKQEGIEVSLATFRASAKAMAPLSTGELNVASGGIDVGLFNSIDDQQNWYFDHGFIDRKTPVDKIVDHRYVDCPLEKLGKLRREGSLRVGRR